MSDRATSFFWYELMTNDLEAAEAFYTSVVGWTAEPFDAPGAPPYLVVKAGDRGVGGLMAFPPRKSATAACRRHGWAISRPTTSTPSPPR